MPWSKRGEQPSNTAVSVRDPAFARLFDPFGGSDLAGVAVTEASALQSSGFYRALSLISGTLAALPLKSYTATGPTGRKPVTSIFDDPDGPDGQTPYEWKETAFLHLLLHGRAGALKVRTASGALVRLPLVHPGTFCVEQPTPEDYQDGTLPAGGVWFRVTLADGRSVKLDANDFWYVPGPSLCGLEGIGLITAARIALGVGLAGDRAAAKMFNRGALMAGIATPADDFDITDDVPEIRRQLNAATSGYENAGTIALINRRLNVTPWTMTNADAQFLQSRSFQIEEISRFTGVPPHLLMSSEKSTSWGTGLEEQNRALGRTVLAPWGNRFEQRASRLLASPRWAEFDFAGLERPAPDREIELLLAQIQGGLLTVNEARAIRNLPPLPETPASVPAAAGEGGNDPSAQ